MPTARGGRPQGDAVRRSSPTSFLASPIMTLPQTLQVLAARFCGHFGIRRYLRVRQTLLDRPLATQVLDLNQLHKAAQDLCGDSEDLRVYGMETDEWYQMGIRILGRTVVEAIRDPQAAFIAASVASSVEAEALKEAVLVDLFVGSGNLLHHFIRKTKPSRAVGFDIDPTVLALTASNFRTLSRKEPRDATRTEFIVGDWRAGLKTMKTEAEEGKTVVALVDPPWGEAYTHEGLDLRRTSPPIPVILRALRAVHGTGPLFAVIKTIPSVVADSFTEIQSEYDVLERKHSPDTAVASRVDYLLIRMR